MNLMLSDDELTRLLGDAAEAFPVPEIPALDVLEPVRRKRVWLAAAAAVAVGGALVLANGGSPDLSKKAELQSAAPALGAAGGTGGTSGTTGGADNVGGVGGDLNRNKFTPTLPYDSTAARSAQVPVAGAPALAAPVPQPAGQPIYSAMEGSAGSSTQTDPGFADGARIVQTGDIGLVVEKGKVTGVTGQLRVLARRAGGYVADEKTSELGTDPSSSITLRVPVKTFDDVVTAVRGTVKGGIGKVESSTSTAADVTAQYADLQAQIGSLTAARSRFLSILAKANTIGETLSVQQRVDDVQARIDRLEGQRRVLAKQSDLATLTVSVSEKVKLVAEAKQSGLSTSWDRAKHGFTSGVESLIAHSGRALLVLIVGVLGLLVLRVAWRLARRRLL
jgi:hypothetical protein